MNEIAKCPCCGEHAIYSYYPHQKITKVMHCGTTCESVELWNRYAAAMALAKKLKELSQCDINTQHAHVEKQVEAAERRVLEVF